MKKKEILKLLNEGKGVKEIVELVDCTEAYVYMVASNNGIDIKRKNAIPLTHDLFSENTTLNKIATMTKRGRKTVLAYATEHGLPYKTAKRLSTEFLDYLENMIFLDYTEINRVYDGELTQLQLTYARRNVSNMHRDYVRNDMLFALGCDGADKTAEAFGLDDEVLNNIMYVYDYGECPYTGVEVEVSRDMKRWIEKGLDHAT